MALKFLLSFIGSFIFGAIASTFPDLSKKWEAFLLMVIAICGLGVWGSIIWLIWE